MTNDEFEGGGGAGVEYLLVGSHRGHPLYGRCGKWYDDEDKDVDSPRRQRVPQAGHFTVFCALDDGPG